MRTTNHMVFCSCIKKREKNVSHLSQSIFIYTTVQLYGDIVFHVFVFVHTFQFQFVWTYKNKEHNTYTHRTKQSHANSMNLFLLSGLKCKCNGITKIEREMQLHCHEDSIYEQTVRHVVRYIYTFQVETVLLLYIVAAW